MFRTQKKQPDPQIARILIYPVKSLDGVAVRECVIGPGGGLQGDRQFCLTDETGKVINGKRESRIHLIRADFDLEKDLVNLSAPGRAGLKTRISSLAESSDAAGWFSDVLGRTVLVKENRDTGFPDDLECPGPTFVAQASLDRVRGWMKLQGEQPEVFAARFRTNVEIGGCPAFWEDQLISRSGARFLAGDVLFVGVRASARCAVPPRHPLTSEVTPNFTRIFSENRRAQLPAWTDPALFDHTYRLCVNTRVPESERGSTIRVADPVRLEFEFDIGF